MLTIFPAYIQKYYERITNNIGTDKYYGWGLDGNLDRCINAVRKAEALGSDLIVFPELTLSGYPPEDLLLKQGFLKKCRDALERFADSVKDICGDRLCRWYRACL